VNMDKLVNRAWAEIDLDCISFNIAQVRRIVGPRTEIMAVVKADAYGHGVMDTVQTMLDAGVSRLAVSMVDEALQLRQFGVDVPILVLGYTDPRRAGEVLRGGITQTVFSHDLAEALSEAAGAEGRAARIHVKIDTGMSRVGFMPGYSAVKDVVAISRLPGIVIEGIFTHFSSADEQDPAFTDHQFELFESILSELNRIGVMIPLRHAANSAGVFAHRLTALDMVRPGIVLYGLLPDRHVRTGGIVLKPAMSLKAHVILVKEIAAGTPVSYGRKWAAERTSRIATIPIGYADGYSRLFTNRARVLVNGQHAPIVGAVCMDQCMVDVTDVNGEVKTGDEVVLFGAQGGKRIEVEELAALAGTIPYEIVCLIGKRIPRVYRRNGEIVQIRNYLI
jgi:alanine racemase